MRTSFAAILVTLAWSLAEAQEPSSVQIESMELLPELEVGTVTVLKINVRHPIGAQVVVENPPNSRKAQLIDKNYVVTEEDGALRTEVLLRYGFFQPGEVTLPSFEIKTEGANPSSLHTQELKRTVASVLTETDVLSPPEPPVPLWVDDYTLVYGAAGLAVVLLGGGAVWVSRRRQPIEVESAPALPPHEIALAALLALESDRWLERGDFMVFFVRLSEVLREYLGHRFDFPGTELTTTEIGVRLSDVQWPPGMDLSDIKAILVEADLVKFGGKVPATDDARALLRRTVTVVELTRLRGPIPTPTIEHPAPSSEPGHSPPPSPSPERQRWMPPENRS